MAKTTGTINIKSIDFNASSNTTEIIWNLGAEAVKEERNIAKSRIMKRAWRRAKAAAERFGGSASQYISSTMSSAWKSERRLASKDVRTKLQGNKISELQKAMNKQAADSVGVDDTDEIVGMLKATMELDQLEQIFNEAMDWGDESMTSGGALESINGANLLEFIEDVRSMYSDEEIMANINKSNLSISALKQLAQELTRAHYDDRYAKWAGGTERFKQDLKRFEQAITGVAGDELVNLFFM